MVTTMSFQLPSIEKLPREVQKKLKKLPQINLYETLAAGYPKGFNQIIDFIATFYNDDSKVAPRLREIGILRIARNTKSAYEAHQHYYLSKATGITDKEYDIIKSTEITTEFTDEENLICKVADELCSKFAISDATYNELYSSFETQAAIEIILCLSMYMQVACIINATRIKIEEDTPLKNQNKPL